MTPERLAIARSGLDRSENAVGVLDDGTVLLVNTPGNSRGLFGVKIQGADVDSILGSDAAYLPGSFDWLIQCKNDPDCKGVLVNHDPTVKEQSLEVTL